MAPTLEYREATLARAQQGWEISLARLLEYRAARVTAHVAFPPIESLSA